MAKGQDLHQDLAGYPGQPGAGALQAERGRRGTGQDDAEGVQVLRACAARIFVGIADNHVRRAANPRMIVLLYGAGRRMSCMQRNRLQKYRKRSEPSLCWR
jgi:hypothetical protein